LAASVLGNAWGVETYLWVLEHKHKHDGTRGKARVGIESHEIRSQNDGRAMMGGENSIEIGYQIQEILLRATLSRGVSSGRGNTYMYGWSLSFLHRPAHHKNTNKQQHDGGDDDHWE